MNNILSQVKLLLMDVDGVLTDGSIIYTDSGEQIKQFNSRDGMGLRLLMDYGIRVGLITGRQSKALLHRCQNLKIDLVFSGISDKGKAIEEISIQTGISTENIAFIGDDLIDIPAMTRVKVGICTADAVQEVKAKADIITKASGGKGAVREICESILKANKKWEFILGKYLA